MTKKEQRIRLKEILYKGRVLKVDQNGNPVEIANGLFTMMICGKGCHENVKKVKYNY